MDKRQINEKSKNKAITLSPINKISKNKIKNFYSKGNNKINLKFNSEENSINKNNNKRKVNYLKFRQKLFEKCNSQILENREILPILSHRNIHNNNNNLSISSKNKEKIALNKTPIRLQKILISQKKKKNIPSLSNIDYDKENDKQKSNDNERNKIPNISPRIKDSKNIYKKEDTEHNEHNNNKKYFIIHELMSNQPKQTSLNYSEEKKDSENINSQNNKREERKSQNFQPFKFSKFYHLSKGQNISAKKIYEHYISEEINQNIKPITSFTRYLLKKFNSPQNKLNKLYGINKSYINNIEEIKNNKFIALKEDFNVQEYQRILLGMVKKRIAKNSLFDLQQNFQKFNDKVLNRFEYHKGRYTKLAEKLKESAPISLIDKLKQLDNDKIIEKAKFFKIKMNKKKQKDKGLDEFEIYLENKFIPDMEIK